MTPQDINIEQFSEWYDVLNDHINEITGLVNFEMAIIGHVSYDDLTDSFVIRGDNLVLRYKYDSDSYNYSEKYILLSEIIKPIEYWKGKIAEILAQRDKEATERIEAEKLKMEVEERALYEQLKAKFEQ